MSCFSARCKISAYIDGMLRMPESQRFRAHIRQCDDCASLLDETNNVRRRLREAPNASPPDKLRTNLRVIASRERQSLEQHHGSRFDAFWEKWKIRIDDLMRPLTLPATGGVLSSLLLFALFAFTITTSAQSVGYEVPLIYNQRVDPNLVPLDLRSAVVLTMALDANGRIIDYAVRDGSGSFTGDATRLQDSSISMPQFPTVLAVAQPVSSDISISFTPLVFRQ